MRRRWVGSLFAAAVVIVGGLVQSGAASAITVPIGGRAWPTTTIRVYDATPALYRPGIRLAIGEWNDARVGVRFVLVGNRRSAQVTILTKELIGLEAGLATLGSAPGATVFLDRAFERVEPLEQSCASLRMPCSGTVVTNLPLYGVPEDVASVTVHELGHILGLKHPRARTGCTIMLARGDPLCGLAPPPAGMWTCRLLQRADVRAAARRYGGRGVVRANPYCPAPDVPSGTPTGLRTVPLDQYARQRSGVGITWRNVLNGHGFRVAVSAPDGPCPTSPTDGAVQWGEGDNLQADSTLIVPWAAAGVKGIPTTTGSYCFAVWSVNGRMQPSASAATLRVSVVSPRPAPVQGVGLTSPAANQVQVKWAPTPAGSYVRMYRLPAGVACPAAASDLPIMPGVVPLYRVDQGAVLNGEPAGPQTYALTTGTADATSPAYGYEATPTCATVTVTDLAANPVP